MLPPGLCAFGRQLNGLAFSKERRRNWCVGDARTLRQWPVPGLVHILKRWSVMVDEGFEALVGFTAARWERRVFGGLGGDLRSEARGLKGGFGGEDCALLRLAAEARGDDRLGERRGSERAGCEAVQKVGHAISR
jgi:hypothetical protein